jgi:hypothetical protein
MIGYDRVAARRNARFHVQIKLTGLPEIPPEHPVQLRGDVARVFRGADTLKPGDPISFTVWVCSRGLEPTGPPFVMHDALLRFGILEAFLDGEPPDCELVGYEFEVVADFSEHPVLPLKEPDRVFTPAPRVEPRKDLQQASRRDPSKAVKPRNWWQFWKR